MQKSERVRVRTQKTRDRKGAREGTRGERGERARAMEPGDDTTMLEQNIHVAEYSSSRV